MDALAEFEITAASSASIVAAFSGFSDFGRFKVMMATAPSCA
jgi:hypothetical protein